MTLDRVYLPLDSFAAAGIDLTELGRPSAGAALRQVLDRALDGCDALLDRAADLPSCMRSRRRSASLSTTFIIGGGGSMGKVALVFNASKVACAVRKRLRAATTSGWFSVLLARAWISAR